MDKDILDKCDVVLDADAPDFAQQFADAIGLKPGDACQIVTPQFERIDGRVPLLPDLNLSQLATLSDGTLKEIGCSKWDEPNAAGETLWLFPAEWYEHIPNGLPVVDINGQTEPFERGKTDDDMRYGMLAYGFIKRAA